MLVAFVFQRAMTRTMKEEDFYMMLSFELGWLTPGEGLAVIEQAVEVGILKRKDGELVPLFDYTSVEIPTGYHFSSSQLNQHLLDFTAKLVLAIMKKSGIGEKKIMEEIEKIAGELYVFPEIAALLLAKKYDVDIEPYFDEAWAFVKKKNL